MYPLRGSTLLSLSQCPCTIKEVMKITRAILSVEGISKANLQVGDAYSVLSVHGNNPSGAQSGAENPRDDRNNTGGINRKDTRGENRGNNRDSCDSCGNNRDRDYRSGGGRSSYNRMNHSNYEPARPNIGAMCGRYNSGMTCQESTCR